MTDTATAATALSFDIVPKGVTVEIKDKAGKALNNVYAGAGWDQVGAATDLDLVGAALNSAGKLTAQTRLIYFGDRTEPGIQLSEDNRTGAGDGDDESMTIDLSKVEADVMQIAIGVAAYSAGDFSNTKNFKFRIVDGTKAADPQVLEMTASGASAGDTVLHAATLKRSGAGQPWTFENVGKFYKTGNGSAAIKGFANLFA
jgi:tellurium resistance protein TerD